MPTFDQGLGKQSEQILLALRSELDAGVFPVGAKLPKEVELCERFGVSRPTVRRAIARLVDEGRLDVRKRAGMFVREHPRAAQKSRAIAIMGMFDEETLVKLQRLVMKNDFLLNPLFQEQRRWDVQTERLFLERVKAERYHALLAFCSPIQPRNDDLLRELADQGTRVIHIEYSSESVPEQEYVLPDYRMAGYQGAVALMLAGYEGLVFAGMRGDGPFAQLQLAGYNAALRAHRTKVDPDEAFFEFPRFGRDPDAAERVQELLDAAPRPLGVYCRSEDVATHVMEQARSAGLSVPDEVGVISAGPLQDGREREACDLLRFDREAILTEALEAAMVGTAGSLRTLVPPRTVQRGTVRSTAPDGKKEELR